MRQLLAKKSIDHRLRDSQASERRLAKTLGPWSLTPLGIGAVLGSGIFTGVGTAIAGQKFDTSSILNVPLLDYLVNRNASFGRPGADPAIALSMVFVGVVCAFTALCHAELASMIPVAGSAFTTLVCMMTWMTTESEIKGFARQWVAAWNSHDLDAIMSHYDVDVVLISPIAAKILDNPSGTIEGGAALRNYFKRGLELYPNLHFELLDVMCGLSTIVVCYKNQKGTRTAEFMEFGKNGKIIRVVANYSG